MPCGGSTFEAIAGCPGVQVGSLGPWNCNLEISDITTRLGNVDMRTKLLKTEIALGGAYSFYSQAPVISTFVRLHEL